MRDQSIVTTLLHRNARSVTVQGVCVDEANKRIFENIIVITVFLRSLPVCRNEKQGEIQKRADRQTFIVVNLLSFHFDFINGGF